MLKILWIEDEAKTFLSEFMGPVMREGNLIEIAETASEAVEFLKSTNYDIVICDLILPAGAFFKGEQLEYGGLSFLKWISDEDSFDLNKIVVFTVVGNPEIHRKIRDLTSPLSN